MYTPRLMWLIMACICSSFHRTIHQQFLGATVLSLFRGSRWFGSISDETAAGNGPLQSWVHLDQCASWVSQVNQTASVWQLCTNLTILNCWPKQLRAANIVQRTMNFHFRNDQFGVSVSSSTYEHHSITRRLLLRSLCSSVCTANSWKNLPPVLYFASFFLQGKSVGTALGADRAAVQG